MTSPGNHAAEIDVVRTFWHGVDLSAYEALALRSFVHCGHQVQLFSYRPLRSIAGVEPMDAGAILPERDVFTYQRGPGQGSVAGFANLFRYRLLYERGGTWSDTDVLCLRSLAGLPDACLGLQSDFSVNCAVMRFPPRHAMVAELCERAARMGPAVGWGQTGPELVSEVLRNHGGNVRVLTSAAFYPIRWRNAWQLLVPSERDTCVAATTGSHCVHWWNELLRRAGIGKERLPPTGSFLHSWAQRILGEDAGEAWPAEHVTSRIAAYRRTLPRIAGGTGPQVHLHVAPFVFTPSATAGQPGTPDHRPPADGYDAPS